jgi:superfamily II DNA or RNA helicase
VLKRTSPYRIVVCAPLRSLVARLQSRLTPFLPHHKWILVDSDGTTNKERVQAFLASNERTVLYTTYDSAVGVLGDVNTSGAVPKQDMVVVDEGHNAYTNVELRTWIGTFPRGLVLTATPQHSLADVLGADRTHSLDFRDAINARLLVDYQVWFPLVRDMSDDRKLEVEIANIPHPLALKALFLLRGMLHTGARRTFAYLSTQDEAQGFTHAFMEVAQRHHGVPAWTGVISSSTPLAKRAELLSEFRGSHRDGQFCVLASVHILDEGIGEPSCDSTFFGSLGRNSSDVRRTAPHARLAP